MAHEDQFTAIGPANEGSGFPRAAFSTKASDMVYGANVAGERCGVYGESALPFESDREADVPGVGVCGVGQNFGVWGKASPGIAGVFGQHNRGGIGIIGAAMEGGTGIVGASLNSLNPSDFDPIPDPGTGSGTGVFGTTSEGVGVRGSSKGGKGGEFISESGVGASGESNTGDGVHGQGVVGVEGVGRSVGLVGRGFKEFDVETGVMGKGAVGVHGEAPLKGGTGVIGKGERGGVFESSLAQIRLFPLKFRTPVGNISGEAGDLMATQGAEDECGLWFCVRSGDASIAEWKQIA